MKKRGVNRKVRKVVYRANRRAGFVVRPALILGGIIAVIVLILLANWLYRVGAFAATPGASQAQLFTDATALIAQTNGDIKSVADLYESEIGRMQAGYEAEIADLNGRIEEAIAADSVMPLTEGTTTPSGSDLTQTTNGNGTSGGTTASQSGFWSRVGQFFANLFS